MPFPVARRGFRLAATLILASVLLSGIRTRLVAQGLPPFAPINPVALSRSALYFQPFRDPRPGRWEVGIALDYASTIEYNRRAEGDYVLDSELLRLDVGLRRDLGERTFIRLDGNLQGAYDGFLDGFLEWYHGLLGIRVSERDRRPRDAFLYRIVLPDGTVLTPVPKHLFLGDLRLGLGVRHSRRLQSVLTVTLPTATGPEGYGRGVIGFGALNTIRFSPHPRLVYEGSLNLGYTPRHGRLRAVQRELFVAATSGLHFRFWGRQALFANLFYHSPYYAGTGLPALDRRELSLDFGWVLTRAGGGEWRIGMTEDLEPSGPGVDLVFRMGARW